MNECVRIILTLIKKKLAHFCTKRAKCASFAVIVYVVKMLFITFYIYK